MVLRFIVCCTIYFINIVQIIFLEKVFIILSQALQLYEKTIYSKFYFFMELSKFTYPCSSKSLSVKKSKSPTVNTPSSSSLR